MFPFASRTKIKVRTGFEEWKWNHSGSTCLTFTINNLRQHYKHAERPGLTDRTFVPHHTHCSLQMKLYFKEVYYISSGSTHSLCNHPP